MTRNRFDQTSRYAAAHLDPAGFLRWLLAPQPVIFHRWLDTRTLPFPGTPERTCDTVACMSAAENEPVWAVVVEFSLKPDEEMFGHLLEYLGHLWRERRPSEAPEARFRVGAAVVNLSGEGQTSADHQLEAAGLRTCLTLRERNLASEPAGVTLDGIAAGTIARCVLPWIALMRGGDDPAIIQRWKELAAAEADTRKRSDYAGLALVFSEVTGRRILWRDALMEWDMIESEQVLEWIQEGEEKGILRTKIADILLVLRKKFPPGAPAEVASVIQASTDHSLLDHWFEAALDAQSLDDFRRAMRS